MLGWVPAERPVDNPPAGNHTRVVRIGHLRAFCDLPSGTSRCAIADRCRCSPAPPTPDPDAPGPRGASGVAGFVRAQPAGRHHPTSLIDDLDRRRSLVRTHPDDHTHAAPSRLKLVRPEQAGHRYVEQHKPLFSLSPCGHPGQAAGHGRATPTTPAGSRKLAASRRTPGPSLARHRSCEKS
jgi:hypothetical protein